MHDERERKPEIMLVIAKAVYESRNGNGCKPWSLLTGSHKDPYLTDAKAALDAYHDYIRRHS